MKEKVCFVVQRYGLEVNGGAELQCRLFAEHISKEYEVEVLTTKAIDHITWKNAYKKDEEIINGVKVRRFKVEKGRTSDFHDFNRKFLTVGLRDDEEIEWVKKQGPFCPALIDYIKTHTEMYRAFVFFTYLYYPTVEGLPIVAEKAIFVPEAHDEPYIRMKVFKNLFYLPHAFFFNTEEERSFVNSTFGNSNIPSDIGGIGIDTPQKVDSDSFKKKYGLDNYIIYVGRIEEKKNCRVLFRYFQEYKKRNTSDLKLVLIGKPLIDIPKDEDILAVGFLDDQDKTNGVAGARLLVLPSEFESLSMVVLEAMCVGTPVIVNGKSDVLKGHCLKSNGALYYNDYFEFEAELNYILTNTDEVEMMTQNAKNYVDENYKWDVITGRLTQLIERI